MNQKILIGTNVRITKGTHVKEIGTIDSQVFGHHEDFPGEPSFEYGVVLEDGDWINVRHDQVIAKFQKSADHRGP